jgi:transcriptional regulator with XRE-family HTH domain
VAEAIDLDLLGKRLKDTRKARAAKLKNVSEETGVSIATLSRIERGEAKAIDGGTLIALTQWLGTPAEDWAPGTATSFPKQANKTTPEVVELHLRADKNLSRQTADALASMFRIAYETLSRQQMGKEHR